MKEISPMSTFGKLDHRTATAQLEGSTPFLFSQKFTQEYTQPPSNKAGHLLHRALSTKPPNELHLWKSISVQAALSEQVVLNVLADVRGRGKEGLGAEQRVALEEAVRDLEAHKGCEEPTLSEGLLNGRWRLLYTSRPGTASPIQRAFVGTESFTIFQEICLSGEGQCRVDNIVEFGKGASIGVLKVQAEASTDLRPLLGFTPRRGPGLPLFGTSQTGPPAKPNMRIDFQFDKAAFEFQAIPFKIPYPVPFKLLGDETKGWIDITYLNFDGTFRLTRGNKGTLFILVKELS